MKLTQLVKNKSVFQKAKLLDKATCGRAILGDVLVYARSKFISGINEQIMIIEADMKGDRYTVKRSVYENGVRIIKDKVLKRWWWSYGGEIRMSVYYGNTTLTDEVFALKNLSEVAELLIGLREEAKKGYLDSIFETVRGKRGKKVVKS